MEIENTTTIYSPNLEETMEGRCLQVTEEGVWEDDSLGISTKVGVREEVLVEVDNMWGTLIKCRELQNQPTKLTITTPSLTLYSWDRITLTDIAIPEYGGRIILYFQFVGRDSGRVDNKNYNYKYGAYERQ